MKSPKWMDCEHNYVRSGHGDDLICTRCGHAAMQAKMTMPTASRVVEPMLREKIEIPFYDGSDHTRISVYKDEFEKELLRSIGLDITHNIFQESLKRGG